MVRRICSTAVTPTPRPQSLRLSRRSFVLGAGAAGTLLATGCGSSGNESGASTSTSNPDKLNLTLRFDANTYALAGIPQRLVVSVLNNKGEPPTDLPATVDFQLTRDGSPVGDPLPTAMHDDGVPVAYYPVRTTIADTGTYAMTATIGGATLSAPMKVSNPDTSALVEPGSALPSVDTPTVDEPRGVDPICTRLPEICPFHEVDLAPALTRATPTVLLVSTPKFCQIGVCGPVLNLLMETRDRYPGLTYVHAEVYTGPAGPNGPLAPTVEAMGLTFEPSIFFVAADGVVAERLDVVFDRTELAAGLDGLAAA
jgi:hypothetical protein